MGVLIQFAVLPPFMQLFVLVVASRIERRKRINNPFFNFFLILVLFDQCKSIMHSYFPSITYRYFFIRNISVMFKTNDDYDK